MSKGPHRARPRARDGQALVEFALLLPVALLLALGILGLMLLVDAAYTVQHAADVAAYTYTSGGSCPQAVANARQAVGEGFGLNPEAADISWSRANTQAKAKGKGPESRSDHCQGSLVFTVSYPYTAPVPLPRLAHVTLVRTCPAPASKGKDHNQQGEAN